MTIFLVEIFADHDFGRLCHRETCLTRETAESHAARDVARFGRADPEWASGYRSEITPIEHTPY